MGMSSGTRVINMVQIRFTLFALINIHVCVLNAKLKEGLSSDLGEHTMVTANDVFPYVAAILKRTSYLCAGALIDESWVLTAGDSLYLMRDSIRILRVRLGSINNRKGGVLLPVKYFEIHPYFDDQKPEYDLALIHLSSPVHFTPTLNPIRIQKAPRELTATHFIVTSWPILQKNPDSHYLESMESIKRKRVLTVAHLHPTNPSNCSEYLDEINVSSSNLMCLDPELGRDPCVRDAGAPVVLNGILWGLVSSWKQEDCDLEAAPSLVTLLAAPNISSWVHSTIRGNKWNKKTTALETTAYDENDYEDD